MTDRLTPEHEAAIATRADAASKGPWSLAYENCECSVDCGHGLYVSRINTGAGPATELLDLPNAEWELMVHAREDIDLLRAELAAVRAERDQAQARIAELERPAIEAKRREIRSSYVKSIAMAQEDCDYESAFNIERQLREREEQWKREDGEVA